ncbi:MAG: gamma-glutamyl-gamma-aminobutyrate hydrolase family protein, partial [Clostridia bacterium]|nr:gamma-glutamyl-gamma-aminobutyrate hydrolase family protein [Clostridia bacterium]
SGVKVDIRWIDSEFFTPDQLEGGDGVLVPGGFGSRGIEGMIEAARCAREGRKPDLGICLGMQILCIANARNVLGWSDANTGEFDPESPHKVIDFMPGQSDEVDKGGTLRLGSWPCEVIPGTALSRCYNKESISERHRHRYEVNNEFRSELAEAGLTFSGVSPDGRLVEAAEVTELPFFIGVQYHPEFKSRPTRPHPLFMGLVEAAKSRKNV